MIVIEDTIEGSSISQDNDSGYSGTRTFVVADLTGVAAGKMLAALEATGIPAIYDVWPGMTMRCYSKNATPINSESTQFKVVCQYKFIEAPGSGGGSGTEPAQITIGSTVQTVQTTEDVTGNTIILGIAGPDGTFDWPGNDPDTGDPITRKLPEQTGLVNIQVPQTVIGFTRRENQNALVNAQDYVGKINDDVFFGCAAGTVLCVRIDSSSNDNGQTFTTSYEFQYDPNGWRADVVYIDQLTGMPLLGAGPLTETMKRIDIYEEVDFDGLNIHIPVYP